MASDIASQACGNSPICDVNKEAIRRAFALRRVPGDAARAPVKVVDRGGRALSRICPLSRAEVPAVAAIVHDLQARFPEVAGNQVARQFCGAVSPR